MQNSFSNYLSLVKFSHTIFALPFAIIGFFLAVTFTPAGFDWKILLLIVLCMLFARNAAMAFNRYIDRKIDETNPRTSVREIPSGIIKPRYALLFVIINSLLFILTSFFINNICFFLSPVALFTVLGYSFTKRFTSLSHFVLGTGLSLAPIGAYLAVTGAFEWLPVFFSLAVLFWVSGFDIIYALLDEEHDKSHNLKSIPALIGRQYALLLSAVLHVATAFFIFYAGHYAGMGWWYWLGAIIFTGLLLFQHTLVRLGGISKVNLAFFTTNGIASVVFAVFVIIELLT